MLFFIVIIIIIIIICTNNIYIHFCDSPVKIVLHVFPAIAPWHIATLCVILSLYIWISEFKELLYYSVKIFFHSILR